jgi:hypothetical protein
MAAALLFWLAWAMMPAVGITDTREIFERVAARRTLGLGAALLMMGAMGSAADAVLHLLAVEMVAPGIDQEAMVPVMERMQAPNLALLGPLLAAFFVGSILLALGCARAGWVPRWNPALFVLALPAPALGGGLALLAGVSASQAWIGAALLRGGRT